MMFASYHSNGTTPNFIDKMNTLASRKLVCSTVSINSYFVEFHPLHVICYPSLLLLFAIISGVIVNRSK